jgi:hypothetical protein
MVPFLFILPKERYSSSKSIRHGTPRDDALSISIYSQKFPLDPPDIIGRIISKMTVFEQKIAPPPISLATLPKIAFTYSRGGVRHPLFAGYPFACQ